MPRSNSNNDPWFSDYMTGANTGAAYNFWSSIGAYHTLGTVATRGRPTSGSSGGWDALGFLALCAMAVVAAYALVLAIIEAYTLGFAVYEYFLNGFRYDPGLTFVATFLLFLASQALLPALLIRSRQIIAALAVLVVTPVLDVLAGIIGTSFLSSWRFDMSSISGRLPHPPLSIAVDVDSLKEGIVGGLILFWFLVFTAVALYYAVLLAWKTLVWSPRLGMRGFRLARRSRAGETLVLAMCVAYLGLCERLLPDLYYLPLGVETFAAIELAMLVGWRRAVAATATWLGLTSLGFPLAEPTMLQPRLLFGPLLGFLVGLLVAVAFAGRVGYGRWANQMFATAAIAHIIFYACGLGWLLLTRSISMDQIASDILLPTAKGLAASIFLTAILFELTAAVAKRAVELEMDRAGGSARFAVAR